MPGDGTKLRRVTLGGQPAPVPVPGGPRTASDRRRTVLAVEDDAATRAMLELALADGGWRVLPADGVEPALELARAHRSDAVLLDLLLGGADGPGDGLAFARAYAAVPAPAPIVLMTAWPLSAVLVEVVGAAATLRKPFELDELFSVLDRVAGGTPPTTHSAAPRAAGGGQSSAGGRP